MKYLLVGFQRRQSITYPHLAQVAAGLFEHGADYCLFRERGYFLEESTTLAGLLSGLLRSLASLLRVAVDSARLLWARVAGNHDLVIACDNVAFVVAGRLFPRVALWSLDFNTPDRAQRPGMVQRVLSAQVGAMLRRHRRMIIQDRDRLELFCETYLGTPAPAGLEAFLLPVSLLPAPARSERPPANRPVLMQIGGISASRSHSDLLLEDYQRNSATYELAFHGYVDAEMSQRIDGADVRPKSSSTVVAPADVFRIVETCDIGFLAYNADTPNFHYIARASGQLVEFLRCGKPVIAFGKSSLEQLIDSEGIGVHIDSISELAEAVRSIAADYEVFSENCRRVFGETYDLGKRIPELMKWLATQSRT